MRKLILSLLLAGVATTPAFAQRDLDGRDQARAERQQAREERQQRQERQERREVREPRVDSVERHRVDAPARAQARAEGRADRRDLEQIRTAREQARSERQDAWQDRRETMTDQRQLRQAERARPPVLRGRVPVVSNTPQLNTQPPARAEQRRYSPTRWSGDWRRDSRYDWYDYRNRYGSLFRLGFYSDPFGWGYQPYSIGWRMWPNYYRSSFWLDDPWQYRLPYAPAGTRWIRYYDDAILVDTWDGQVVDVIHNFFW